MKNLIICGSGAFARELYWHALESIGFNTEWNIKGFLDGSVKLPEEAYQKLPLPVLGNYRDYKIEKNDVFTCAVGNPYGRKEFINTIEGRGGEFINIIHKTAIVHHTAQLGKGIILCPFTYIFADAKVMDYAMLEVNAGIGHDAQLGVCSCMLGFTELCGFSHVGNYVYIGSGARVLPKIKIGDDSFIGAGSVVLVDVDQNMKVFGNPARPVGMNKLCKQ